MTAKRLAHLYDKRLQGYVYWKVRLDPAYRAVRERLRGREREPLLDLGCGVGIFAFFLRESGIEAPIVGVDFDDRKIAVARRTAAQYENVEFLRRDARDPLPANHNVIVIDVLQYFDAASQRKILANVAGAVPPGGIAVFRQGVRDSSLRYRLQRAVDGFARVIRWMRAERLQFPSREEIVAGMGPEFDVDVTPLWGRLPYNNYLFVFTRRTTPATPREAGRPPG